MKVKIVGIILIFALLAGNAAAMDARTFLKEDHTEQKALTDTYKKVDFAKEVKKNAKEHGIDSEIWKVKYTKNNKIYTRYLNVFDGGNLIVDETGTPEGTGIDKVVTNLEKGEMLKESPLFTSCKLNYNKGTVKSIKVTKL